jgi:hypothetical protein
MVMMRVNSETRRARRRHFKYHEYITCSAQAKIMLANKMGMTIGGTNQAAMAATPARFFGSSYSGDAPLGMHAGQQQNKHDCCRREEKKVCG